MNNLECIKWEVRLARWQWLILNDDRLCDLVEELKRLEWELYTERNIK